MWDELPALLFAFFLMVAVVGVWGLIIWAAIDAHKRESAIRKAQHDVARAAQAEYAQATSGVRAVKP